jgi:hypothetical protein
MRINCQKCGGEVFLSSGKNLRKEWCYEQANCVTQDGVKLMFCDACQRTLVRNHPRNLPIDLSLHARRRFLERCLWLMGKPQSSEETIHRMYWNSRPIVFSDRFMRKRWIISGDADYYLSGNFVFVVTAAKPFNLKTIEPIGGKELGVDYWFLIEDNHNCLCVN